MIIIFVLFDRYGKCTCQTGKAYGPYFRILGGPIRCELADRRAAKLLRSIICKLISNRLTLFQSSELGKVKKCRCQSLKLRTTSRNERKHPKGSNISVETFLLHFKGDFRSKTLTPEVASQSQTTCICCHGHLNFALKQSLGRIRPSLRNIYCSF